MTSPKAPDPVPFNLDDFTMQMLEGPKLGEWARPGVVACIARIVELEEQGRGLVRCVDDLVVQRDRLREELEDEKELFRRYRNAAEQKFPALRGDDDE